MHAEAEWIEGCGKLGLLMILRPVTLLNLLARNGIEISSNTLLKIRSVHHIGLLLRLFIHLRELGRYISPWH